MMTVERVEPFAASPRPVMSMENLSNNQQQLQQIILRI
jgi:hypothetical protein